MVRVWVRAGDTAPGPLCLTARRPSPSPHSAVSLVSLTPTVLTLISLTQNLPHYFLESFPVAGKTSEGVGEESQAFAFPSNSGNLQGGTIYQSQNTPGRTPLLLKAEQLLNHTCGARALDSGAREDQQVGAEGRGRRSVTAGLLPAWVGLQCDPHLDLSLPQEERTLCFAAGQPRLGDTWVTCLGEELRRGRARLYPRHPAPGLGFTGASCQPRPRVSVQSANAHEGKHL